MSIRAVVTRGYGTFGTIPDVARRGYGASAVIPPVVVVEESHGWLPVRKKLHEKPRDDTKDDLERAWRALTESTQEVREIVAAPASEPAIFQPAENRLVEALAIAGRLLEDVGPRVERARLRQAAEAAREAQRRLQARMEAERLEAARIAEEERVAAEMKAKKRRRYRAAALIAMHLLDD